MQEINPIYLEPFSDSPLAKSYFVKGYEMQMSGFFRMAVLNYKKSLQIKKTSEAYTFLGWAFGSLNKYKPAIKYCHRAIETDPSLGNPYNDIGVYLMEQRKFPEAIPWFEKAKFSSRYECPFYPYYNLGKIFELTGRIFKAKEEYEGALKVHPNYEPAVLALKRLKSFEN